MAGVILGKSTARRVWQATQAFEQQNNSPGTQPNYARFPGAHAIFQIMLTATVAAADWSAGSRKLTPTEFTANILSTHEDGAGAMTYFDDRTVSGKSYYTTAVTVDSGKGRLAWLVDGRLLVADCSQVNLE